jgi:type VI secretion system secreted protein VgrG
VSEVDFTIADGATAFQPLTLRGTEALGVASAFELLCAASAPIAPSELLGQAAVITIRNGHGERTIRGVVERVAAVATSDPTIGRRYRVAVRSILSTLALRRRPRVFQKLSVPDVVKQVLEEGGYGAGNVEPRLSGAYDPRDYLVQYDETDLTFVRRICEEEGIFLRFVAGDDAEQVVIEDDTTNPTKAIDEPLLVVDGTGLNVDRPIAFDHRVVRRMRPGKVTLRDYEQENPRLELEAVKQDGAGSEKKIEVYEAPGRFKTPGDGTARATTRLQALRSEAVGASFSTTALTLAPGLSVVLERGDQGESSALTGEHVAIAARHAWDGQDYVLSVDTVPKTVRYRLPRTTPRPIIHGLHHAFVTTAAGEEINVDAQGRVRLHFPWDREGPTDDKSSLPVRVMQPNTPGSQLLPRGGWEVLVAFEDGDPDRPYVVGRAFNAKAPPPYGLPANKTVTSLGTVSSPGGAKENRINIDDAAGRQNLSFLAGFGKSTTVSNNLVTQTANNEDETVTSSQVRTIGANEDISVTQAHRNTIGSQSATVGGMQKIFVKGDHTIGLGSQTILVGAACLEKVGNPVSGMKNLAQTAAMEGASALGIPVDAIMTGAAVVQAGVRGYQSGGFDGAVAAMGGEAASQLAGRVAGMVPGGELMLGAVGGGSIGPWVEGQLGPGANASGGGASGGSDAAAAAGPGPGHRNTIVEGAMLELIGAACTATSPGKIGCTTIGASTFLVGGSHNIRASTTGSRTLGVSTEVLGSYRITTTGDIERDIKGAIATTIAGGLDSKASGGHSIKAGALLDIDISGALTMKGGTIAFVVGGSSLVATSGGVKMKSSRITITGNTKASGAHHT